MNGISDGKINAQFNAKGVWSVLWVLALLNIITVLRFITVLKWEVCIMFCVIALTLSVLGFMVGMRPLKAKLEVDGEYVFYKTVFGRQKYLPLNSVTAVGTSFFNTVYVVSPSCKIKCMLVRNKDEIVEAVKNGIEKTK